MIYVHSLGRAARYYSEQTALFIDSTPITFRELDSRVARIAGGLIKHGLRPGDRLAALLPNGSDFIQLVYACGRIGLIIVPINTESSAAEIDRVLNDSTPRGLVQHPASAEPSTKVPWQLVLDGKPLDIGNGLPPEVFYNPEAILAMIYTSGTRGDAKGVMLTHANVFSNVNNLNYWMHYRENGIYLHAAPMFHIADFPALFGAAAAGSSQLSLSHFSPGEFCEAVEKERVTHTVLASRMFEMLAEFSDVKRFNLSSLEVIAYDGSPIAPARVRTIKKLFPNVKLVQVYGLTETGFLTGLQDHEHTIPSLARSCGRPSPGIDVQVMDKSGVPVAFGQRGELVARGPNVMLGYWNRPDNTARSFRNGFFRTGDIGYQDEAGFFYIVGRAGG